jgi:hypothetical protein
MCSVLLLSPFISLPIRNRESLQFFRGTCGIANTMLEDRKLFALAVYMRLSLSIVSERLSINKHGMFRVLEVRRVMQVIFPLSARMETLFRISTSLQRWEEVTKIIPERLSRLGESRHSEHGSYEKRSDTDRASVQGPRSVACKPMSTNTSNLPIVFLLQDTNHDLNFHKGLIFFDEFLCVIARKLSRKPWSGSTREKHLIDPSGADLDRIC